MMSVWMKLKLVPILIVPATPNRSQRTVCLSFFEVEVEAIALWDLSSRPPLATRNSSYPTQFRSQVPQCAGRLTGKSLITEQESPDWAIEAFTRRLSSLQ